MTIIFNDTSTTNIYTLSLHDALPICIIYSGTITIGGNTYVISTPTVINSLVATLSSIAITTPANVLTYTDRKSTRLNSSYVEISYAVFCLIKLMYFVLG